LEIGDWRLEIRDWTARLTGVEIREERVGGVGEFKGGWAVFAFLTRVNLATKMVG
jgi:hypothetical protein